MSMRAHIEYEHEHEMWTFAGIISSFFALELMLAFPCVATFSNSFSAFNPVQLLYPTARNQKVA